MASLDDMVSQLPMDQIAQALGVDEATAAAATKKAIPALVQGMQANATSDPAKAAALAKAIAAHAQQAAAASATRPPPAPPPAGIDMSNVDTADGEKIVGHAFGDNTEQVADDSAEWSAATAAPTCSRSCCRCSPRSSWASSPRTSAAAVVAAAAERC